MINEKVKMEHWTIENKESINEILAQMKSKENITCEDIHLALINNAADTSEYALFDNMIDFIKKDLEICVDGGEDYSESALEKMNEIYEIIYEKYIRKGGMISNQCIYCDNLDSNKMGIYCMCGHKLISSKEEIICSDNR